MRTAIYYLVFLLLFSTQPSNAQTDAAQIRLNIEKLNFLGSVLYMAAHPDDENTRIITYLSKGKLASTAYLSITRGDGGQNLIGPEIGELLGTIRTQELLAARRIDGGEQFFTRAVDFGFSKSPEETFHFWGKNEVLSDVLTVFNKFQPDVIITRFPPDERAGHGHHTASALLAREAFDIIASKTSTGAPSWKPVRLYTNTGRWWDKTINENTPEVLTMNVGIFNPLLGKSYSEIAANSRSQHKSQGFGSTGNRGYQPEFLEYVAGEKAHKDIFEGINTTWSRIQGGEKINGLVDNVLKQFNPSMPYLAIPSLIQIRNAIQSLDAGTWKDRKLKEVEGIIHDCLGLYLEVSAKHFWITPGEGLHLDFEITKRAPVEMILKRIYIEGIGLDSTLSLSLPNDKSILLKKKGKVKQDKPYSSPYWLNGNHDIGRYNVEDKNLIGSPENKPSFECVFTFSIGGETLTIHRSIAYKWNDPVKGELSRPLEVVPPVLANLSDPVYVFADAQPRTIQITLTAAISGSQKGEIKCNLPAGWKSEPATIPFSFSKQGEVQVKSIIITPSLQESTGVLKLQVETEGKRYGHGLKMLVYDHIPIQTLLPPSEAKLVRLDIAKAGNSIAYINGAGDDIPKALRNMGYDVWNMKDDEVTMVNLKRMDAVVLGIRALNTRTGMKTIMNTLLDYVYQGGTLLVQYNTNAELQAENYSPYPLHLSRDRVTQEEAPVHVLKPLHPVINTPNKISSSDFDGWVQERGLYFPDSWGKEFTALLSMKDGKEKPKEGSLLVAPYGKGWYIYTGLSFFRQLPQGIPGCYKLFTNLVSIGKSFEDGKKTQNNKNNQ